MIDLVDPSLRLCLAQITLGPGCSIGCRAIITAGTSLPPLTCMGPLSCSHELPPQSPSRPPATTTIGSDPPPPYPSPRVLRTLKLLLGYPVLLLSQLVSLCPRLLCLGFLVLHFDLAHHSSSYWTLLTWFATWQRGAYYLLVRCIRVLVTPPLHLLFALTVKHTLLGRFQQGVRTHWGAFQTWVMTSLLTPSDVTEVTVLLGRHFEGVSMVYRWLGAKVGQRIYWPGSGLAITGTL